MGLLLPTLGGEGFALKFDKLFKLRFRPWIWGRRTTQKVHKGSLPTPLSFSSFFAQVLDLDLDPFMVGIENLVYG